MDKVVFLLNDNFTSTWIFYSFIIAFCIFIISEFYISNKTRRNSEKKIEKDGGSFYVIIFCTWFIVALNFYTKIEQRLLISIFQYIGVIMMLIGIIIRVYSVKLLDKAFTLHVCTGDNQKIIKRGIYKLVRHPAYLGSVITMIGMSMALRNEINLAITIIILILMYGYRIKIEEKALISRFGEDYLEYKKETRFIIPKIL
ncbi:MAG: methyltransferase family protein [Clostridium sp.]